jgi:two-component system copper resistance phosphate regulon response regulator CusR
MQVLVLYREGQASKALLKALEDQLFSVEATTVQDHPVDCTQIENYDCILLDGLPDQQALRSVRLIRGASTTVGIVILGASDPPEFRTALYEGGADECFSRPFSLSELVAKMRALLRRQHSGSDHTLRVADLELDCVRHTVHRGGKLLQLTNREFVLLEYLVRNADRPLTRSMIMERVWKQQYDGLTNVVDVFINLLRRKVDREFEPKLVHTARGVGYLVRNPLPSDGFAGDRIMAERQTS